MGAVYVVSVQASPPEKCHFATNLKFLLEHCFE